MRHARLALGLVVAQLAALVVLAQPAAAAYVVTCDFGYGRTSSGSSYDSYESGYGVGYCSHAVPRIDVRLTYVYCTSSSSSSCNTTGSNFANSGFGTTRVEAHGAVYNLRGWYKAVVRVSFTTSSDQVFYGPSSCGQSATNYYSCAGETAPFYRGDVI